MVCAGMFGDGCPTVQLHANQFLMTLRGYRLTDIFRIMMSNAEKKHLTQCDQAQGTRVFMKFIGSPNRFDVIDLI
jgi:hypothetical protein